MCQDHECACYDGEAYERIAKLEQEIAQMTKAFAHLHTNNGLDDFCRQCGLYLTHPVHSQRKVTTGPGPVNNRAARESQRER